MRMTIRMSLVLVGLTGVLAGVAPLAQAETFLELYRQAMTSNPTLQGHEQHVTRVQALEDGARSRLRPQLSATGSNTWNHFHTHGADSDQYPTSRASLQARQALFDAPGARRLKAAKARTAQTRQELDAMRMEVTLDLVQRYLEALAATDEIVYLESEKKSVASQLERLRRMHERQMAKITDVYETEAYYTTLLANELKARGALAVALEKLREVTGVAVRDIPLAKRESFPFTPGTIEQWVREGLKHNPDLQALQQAMEAEAKTVASTRAEHWPRLSLVASETFSDSGYDNRESSRYDVAAIGVQLDVPIYEGGRVMASTRETEARYQVARLQHEARRRELEQEIRAAYLSTVSDHALINATSQAVQAQERTRDAQLRAHELGVSTIVDVLDAERRLFKARSDQSKACNDFINSLVTLRLQVGSLSETDIEELNVWLGASPTPARTTKAANTVVPRT